MRASMATTIVTVLLLSGAAVAQGKSESREFTPGTSAKALMVSGRVSNDGKTFLTDVDSDWTVSNPEILKGHEGNQITVKCYVDTERNTIHVLSVKRTASEANYATNHSDSAFRR